MEGQWRGGRFNYARNIMTHKDSRHSYTNIYIMFSILTRTRNDGNKRPSSDFAGAVPSMITSV